MKSRLEMVGPNGLEPSTSSVSGKRSNQLSYGPIAYGVTSLTQTIRPQNSNRSQGPQRYGVNVTLIGFTITSELLTWYLGNLSAFWACWADCDRVMHL